MRVNIPLIRFALGNLRLVFDNDVVRCLCSRVAEWRSGSSRGRRLRLQLTAQRGSGRSRSPGREARPAQQILPLWPLCFFVAISVAAARGTPFRGYKNAALSWCLRWRLLVPPCGVDVFAANNHCAATTERGPPLPCLGVSTALRLCVERAHSAAAIRPRRPLPESCAWPDAPARG
jgi:hypothetical protein